jgi:hypothetical protein
LQNSVSADCAISLTGGKEQNICRRFDPHVEAQRDPRGVQEWHFTANTGKVHPWPRRCGGEMSPSAVANHTQTPEFGENLAALTRVKNT